MNTPIRQLIQLCFCFLLLTACKRENSNTSSQGTYYPNFLLAGKTIGEGISYSDIPDDTLIHMLHEVRGSSVAIDIDQDGIKDFNWLIYCTRSRGAEGYSIKLAPIGENAVIASKPIPDCLDTIPLNDTINNTKYWVKNTCTLYSYTDFVSGMDYTYGIWKNFDRKYIGLKIVKNGNEIFAWMRVKIINKEFIIYDFAYTKPIN